MKSVTCFAIIAGELFTGVTMLAAYQAWIQPGAPRFHAQAKAAEASAAPIAPVVVAPAPVVPAPAIVEVLQPPPPVAVAPVPKAAAPAVVVAPKRPTAVAAQPKPQTPARQPAVAPTPRLGSPPHQATVIPPAPGPIPSPLPRQLTPHNDPATSLQRGMTALNSHDFAAAVTLLRQARQMQPANPDLGYLMGVALEGTGELGAAIDAFRSCKSGPYQQIARSHLKALVKKLGKQ